MNCTGINKFLSENPTDLIIFKNSVIIDTSVSYYLEQCTAASAIQLHLFCSMPQVQFLVVPNKIMKMI